MAGNRRVLIVDDDVDFADSLHDVLEAENYLIKIANNASDALSTAETFAPHVALLDIRLGQTNGFELLTMLKQKHPHLLCIIMTAYADIETAIKALQSDAYDYLRKPLYPPELAVTLNRCFEKIDLEQKNQQATTALRASEERYRSIFENALEGIFRITPAEGFTDVNPALVQMLGYNSKKEVLALNLQEDLYAYPAEQQYVLDQYQSNKVIRDLEVTWKKKKGEYIIVSLNSQIIQDAQGQILFYEGTAQDITERKWAEEEVRRRNRELALLNRVIAASAAGLELENFLETVCRELAQAFGVPQVAATLLNPEKTEGVVVADYSIEGHPSTAGQTVPVENNPSFQHVLTHKTPLAVDDAQSDPRLAPVHDLMCHRGTVSLLLLPLLYKEQVLGSLCLNFLELRHFSTEEVNLAQSVAEQVAGALARAQLDEQHRQLEEQYRQSQKMEAIGRLAGGMAHDFNNLLTVITGYSELLLHRHVDSNDPQYKDIEQINKAGNRAKALTRQLLAFSRQQVIQPEALDLNTIITDINQMLRRLVSENIDLITILNPRSARIKADPGQIEQVIMNLVVNACDAMPRGGKLTIKTANVNLDEDYASRHIGLEPGSYIMLTISDTGIGMDAETLSHIFEPFFTTKAKGKGTGLGLAIVYGIVQQNEGYISVSSEPGRGTTFQIYLPRLEQAPELAGRDQVSAESPRGTETILLVEDEDMVRDLVRYALLQDGYNVLEARHGQDALKVCEKHEGPIHLLLTDVIMPGGLTGRDLAERLLSLHPEIKILYMSGYTDDAIVHHGILDPDIAFLQKPFTPTVLSRKVREILDASQMTI